MQSIVHLICICVISVQLLHNMRTIWFRIIIYNNNPK